MIIFSSNESEDKIFSGVFFPSDNPSFLVILAQDDVVIINKNIRLWPGQRMRVKIKENLNLSLSEKGKELRISTHLNRNKTGVWLNKKMGT